MWFNLSIREKKTSIQFWIITGKLTFGKYVVATAMSYALKRNLWMQQNSYIVHFIRELKKHPVGSDQ